MLLVGLDDKTLALAPTADAGVDTGVDAGADALDAPSDDGADVRDAGPCRLDLPFGPLTAEPVLSSGYAEESVRLTPNRLEAYVARRTFPNFVEIFHFTRQTVGHAWISAGKEPLLALYPDGGLTSALALTFFSDGLNAILQYYDNDTGHGRLYSTTRASLGATWSAPALIPELKTDSSDEGPWLSQDGNTIYFFSDRQTTNPRLYSAARSGSVFGAPKRLPAINPDNDTYPVLTGDELTAYFSSFTPIGNTGLERKLYRATRASTSQNLGGPTEVTELNADGWKTVPTWISPDGCELYVIASRPSSANQNTDVYRATKPAN